MVGQRIHIKYQCKPDPFAVVFKGRLEAQGGLYGEINFKKIGNDLQFDTRIPDEFCVMAFILVQTGIGVDIEHFPNVRINIRARDPFID